MNRLAASLAVSVFTASAIFFLSGAYAEVVSAGSNATDRVTAPEAILLVEDFSAATGTAITSTGWTSHSAAGTNPIVTSAPGLTLAGYPSSGIGNAVTLAASGEDDNRTFPVQTSGSVYAAFMANVTDATVDAAGGYFFHLGPDPVSTTFRGRVFAKKDASNNLAFGISKSLTAATDIAFTPFSYSLGTTYLIVVKYTIVAGTTNDTVTLIVSPTVPGTEPAATVTATDTTQTDINPGTVSLRQGTAGFSPAVRVDGIRVGTDWSSITTPIRSPVDFNGDGKTDFAVVRNTGGGTGGQVTWFWELNGAGSSHALQWGISTDTFVPVDFDGDGKSDIAVYREGAPTVAAFYILQSQTNTLRIETFGQTGDNPKVVEDYDGDGKADPAVYRPGANPGNQSVWYYRGSLNNPGGNVTYVQWGLNGDLPVAGDFDGDGRNDFVVQRNGGGGQARFWMLQTTAGFNSVIFGMPTDVIVPGDYDGDGKTDLAVSRGSGGQLHWFVRPSSTGVISAASTVFGSSATDFHVQGDYDGDGRTDFAVWRSSVTAGESGFFALRSTSGPLFVPFGQSGDYPVANYNRF